jgi:hypothetical protein
LGSVSSCSDQPSRSPSGPEHKPSHSNFLPACPEPVLANHRWVQTQLKIQRRRNGRMGFRPRLLAVAVTDEIHREHPTPLPTAPRLMHPKRPFAFNCCLLVFVPSLSEHTVVLLRKGRNGMQKRVLRTECSSLCEKTTRSPGSLHETSCCGFPSVCRPEPVFVNLRSAVSIFQVKKEKLSLRDEHGALAWA